MSVVFYIKLCILEGWITHSHKVMKTLQASTMTFTLPGVHQSMRMRASCNISSWSMFDFEMTEATSQ